MKNKITLLIFMCAANLAFAYIAPSHSILDSLKTGNNQWSISLLSCHYQNGNYKNTIIDSIVFSNHTDSAKVKQAVINNIVKLNNYYSYKLTVDSLEKTITIKQAGDMLRVVVYGHNDSGKWKYKDSLLFGNEVGACVRAPKDGEFLSSQSYYGNACGASICNDKTCYAVLKGRIYDKNGEALKNKTFDTFSYLGSFTTDGDGYYSINVTTGFDVSETFLRQAENSFLKDPSIKDTRYFDIEPIAYNANPGDIIERDIHLKTNYLLTHEHTKVFAQFFCAPNPAHAQIVFNYLIDNTISMNNVALLVYNASGKLMDQLKIESNEGSLTYILDARYTKGSYSYTVRDNEQLLYQGHFFVQ